MNNIKKLFAGILFLASIASMSACKKTYDQPPGPSDDVNIVANTTIATLKALHTVSGAYDVITSDIIISGIVTANDKSGNLYKQIFIQDSTGAMQIMLEASSVYGSFPVGRKVWVRCKGLCLTDYHYTLQLGMLTHSNGIASVQGILPADISNYVIGGSINNEVTPFTVTVGDLGIDMQNKYINALVKLEGYEFVSTDTSKTYSDTSAYKNTENRLINQGCTSPTAGTIIVRNSAYADFAAVKIPTGHGSITSIYTIYKSSPTSSYPPDKQLLLRDINDVQFNDPRCGSSNPPPTGTPITMAQLRALYPGSGDFTLPAGTILKAKVISFSANEASGNFRIQDESNAGVVLYAAIGSPVYPLNTVLLMDASGGILTLYNGDLELKSVPLQNVSISADPVNITPRVATCQEIITNRNTWSSTMVTINNLTSIVNTGTSGSGTNYTVSDATGTLKMYVRTASAISVNTAGNTITGYVSLYNTDTQIGIRSAADIQ